MPKIVDHDRYREELLVKCYDFFTRRGFSNVTMQEVADELDISKGQLYHYFPRKQSILEQMFLFMTYNNVKELVKLLSAAGSFEEKLSVFLDFMLDNESGFQNFLLLTIDILRNFSREELDRIFLQWSSYYLDTMKEHFGSRMRTTDIVMILSHINGLLYQRMLFPNLSSRDQLNRFREMLLVFFGKK